MVHARCDSASLTGARDNIARAFELFGLGREADEPQVLALLETTRREIAAIGPLSGGPVAGFWRDWAALAAVQIEALRGSNRPTRVAFGTALLSLEFLVNVIELQRTREGVPEHCTSCESPHLTPIAEEAATFECRACGLRSAYPA